MKPIPFIPMIEPVIYRSAPPHVHGRKATMASLCRQAGIRLRSTAPERAIVIYSGCQQIRTPHTDVVGVPTKSLTSPEAALRALEALAHSFHDHGARACVCGRGLFSVPTLTPATE